MSTTNTQRPRSFGNKKTSSNHPPFFLMAKRPPLFLERSWTLWNRKGRGIIRQLHLWKVKGEKSRVGQGKLPVYDADLTSERKGQKQQDWEGKAPEHGTFLAKSWHTSTPKWGFPHRYDLVFPPYLALGQGLLRKVSLTFPSRGDPNGTHNGNWSGNCMPSAQEQVCSWRDIQVAHFHDRHDLKVIGQTLL